MEDDGDDQRTLTKQDLVRFMSDGAGLRHAEAKEVVEMFLGYLTSQLAAGRRIEIRDFGVFEVFEGRARTGRNLQNPSEAIAVPARAKVRFKPGKALREKVARILPQLRMREQ